MSTVRQAVSVPYQPVEHNMLGQFWPESSAAYIQERGGYREQGAEACMWSTHHYRRESGGLTGRQARTGALCTELTQPDASKRADLRGDLKLEIYKKGVWKPWLKREDECSCVSMCTCPQPTGI